MDKISIDDKGAEELLRLPETGMGFQLVDATFWGVQKELLVFNAAIALDLSVLNLERPIGVDVAALLRNEARIVAALNSAITTMVAAPGPRNFRLRASRIGSVPASSTAVTPSALVKHVTLSTVRAFHRFSAFSPDRRVDPKTGDFLPGTYAAPSSEVPFVPTGFAAVGRFALPNTAPASHHYVMQAAAGTVVSFGTVAPAFSQAGGGVEAFFPTGATNQPPSAAPSRLADE
jgi:hypothetical protein